MSRFCASPHILWLAQKPTLVKETMVKGNNGKSDKIVIYSSFFELIQKDWNQFINDSAISWNQVELIVIFPVIFLTCITTRNFSWKKIYVS